MTQGSKSAVVTIPNALSLMRLMAVPYFFWLIVVPHRDGMAVVVLAAASFTDWLDGYLARALNQQSRIGELLDPIADRLYIAASIIALLLRDMIPLWVVVALLARDVVMTVLLSRLKTMGITGLPVHFMGKAATLNLLYAMPLLLLSSFSGMTGTVAHALGWAFLWWGVALYWYAGWLYAQQARDIFNERST